MIKGDNFFNGVYTCFHDLTGVEQHITSAKHPQSNGLVERQNRTIRNVLVKVLEHIRRSDRTSLKVFFLRIT